MDSNTVSIMPDILRPVLCRKQFSCPKRLIVKRNRLGKCEVCATNNAKYTCPKCEVKTCGSPCLQIHKKELTCNGVRDRTKFIPLKKMTKMDFASDYYFLEQCTRFVEDRKHDRLKRYTRYNKVLPTTLFRLRNAAATRNTTLRFLLENFSRHKGNSSYLDWKKDIIYWQIDWIFTNAQNLKYVDEKCCEENTLHSLLDKYVNPKNTELVPKKKCLEYYQSQGFGNLSILLKAEGIKRCRNRFFRLDCTKTLKENLCGKVIVEYPCIYVTYDNNSSGLDVIDSDDDLEGDSEAVNESTKTDKQVYKRSLATDNSPTEKTKKRRVDKNYTKQSVKHDQLQQKPSNYLFLDEKPWDDFSSSSDTDGGNETEEEDAPKV